MKIVHLVNYYSPKMKYQEYYLIREQVKAGHEVVVITSERIFPFPDYENTVKSLYGERILQAGTFQEEGYTIHRLAVRKEIGARVMLKGVGKLITQIQPDYVLAHGIIQAHTLTALYHKDNYRLVIDEHMLYSDLYPSRLKMLSYQIFGRFFKRKMRERTQKIVGISDGTMVLMKDLVGLQEQDIELIPLGVDIDLFFPNPQKRTNLRTKLGLKETDVLITYTGKIAEYKKVHLLVETLNDVSSEDLVLAFVGNVTTDYKEAFTTSLENSIHRTIFVPAVQHHELAMYYNATDIAVWPAHQTISTLEASACGVPIICSDYLKERYKNDNGIGIKSGDAKELKTALLKLINDKSLRQDMGQRGWELIAREMSWKAVSETFLK